MNCDSNQAMNAWDKRRNSSGWKRTLVEWGDDDTIYLSVVFSWQLQEAYQSAVWHRMNGFKIKVGGPAVELQPDFFVDVADQVGSDYPDAVAKHNQNATFTSRGCVRQCKFCAVPKTEGHLVELDN